MSAIKRKVALTNTQILAFYLRGFIIIFCFEKADTSAVKTRRKRHHNGNVKKQFCFCFGRWRDYQCRSNFCRHYWTFGWATTICYTFRRSQRYMPSFESNESKVPNRSWCTSFRVRILWIFYSYSHYGSLRRPMRGRRRLLASLALKVLSTLISHWLFSNLSWFFFVKLKHHPLLVYISHEKFHQNRSNRLKSSGEIGTRQTTFFIIKIPSSPPDDPKPKYYFMQNTEKRL